jgi:hypothetical protein
MSNARGTSAFALRCAPALLVVFVGCRQTSSEYVEAELRVQSRKVADLEQRVAQRDAEIETLRNTVTTYQASHVKPTEAPETVYRDTALSRISLTLATGGKDADLDGRDDGIVVGVAPHDYDGDVFKCPGSCRIQLFESPASGVKKQIGEWIVPAERLRANWRTSLLGQGYHLSYSWQTPPSERRLRVLVTFTTVDGRTFQAEKDFDVSTQAKGPPKMPGGKIEAEPVEVQTAPQTPSIPSNKSTVFDPPKPKGLGALTPATGGYSLGPSSIKPIDAPKLLPAPQAPPKFDVAKPPAIVEKKPVQSSPDHSVPPVIDHDRQNAASSSKSSPGHLADEQDVIVLPAAMKSKAPAVPPPEAPKKSIEPVKDDQPLKPAVAAPPPKPAASMLDRITLPDEPAPPKAFNPSNIQLPN